MSGCVRHCIRVHRTFVVHWHCVFKCSVVVMKMPRQAEVLFRDAGYVLPIGPVVSVLEALLRGDDGVAAARSVCTSKFVETWDLTGMPAHSKL